MLQDRAERNRLRQVIMAAEKKKVVSQEEIGFIVTLIERFRVDLDKKVKQMSVLQGEITQLKYNEQVIMTLIENMISAAERALERQERFDKMKNESVEEEILDQTDIVSTEEVEEESE
jgi:hypothetical protein